jgi:hypothetical protein
MTRALTILPVLLAASCAAEPDVVEVEPIYARCSAAWCPGNAASAGDGLLFDEFHLGNANNYAGVRMTGASDPSNAPIEIDVRYGHELIGRYPGGGVLTNGSLVGTVIHFAYDEDDGTIGRFHVRIAGVDGNHVRFLSGDTTQLVPVYDLRVYREGTKDDDEHFVCGDAVDATWSAQVPHHAIIFRGDRYDPQYKTVIESDTVPISMPTSYPWAFIACGGSGASKLHLYRHTHAGGYSSTYSPAFTTTLLERTTLYKAIVADYCGTGQSFTVDGTKLVWATTKDPSAWPFPWSLGSVRYSEAVWGPTGATCLDRARLWPDHEYIRDKIQVECGRVIPTCAQGPTAFAPNWASLGHVVTAIP